MFAVGAFAQVRGDEFDGVDRPGRRAVRVENAQPLGCLDGPGRAGDGEVGMEGLAVGRGPDHGAGGTGVDGQLL